VLRETEESSLFPLRAIRSFTLRQGRITSAQAKALEELWPVYGLDPAHPFEPAVVYGREAPVILEIGFGNGETLAQMAAERLDANFLGIEVHGPGIGHLLLRIVEKELANLRVYRADAVSILAERIPDESLAGVNVFFPDPWPKSRHHKRRLVNPDFLDIVARKLKPGGTFHAATDWEDYARQMLSDLEASRELANQAGAGCFSERPANRPETKFERRGKRLGHGVFDLVFVRR
jgi:tRNA (guanine-N7-)-methyltransferase